jgi:NAD(P)H-quinone oxidoreductase subunit 6
VADPALALASLPIPDLTPHLPGLVFAAFAGLAVVSAIMAATAPRIVHAAFALMATFFGVAGLYATLGADFVALAQVIVYVGGILVLLVFGILLTGRLRGTLGLERPSSTLPGIAVGGVLFLGLLLALRGSDFHPAADPGPARPTTAPIGRAFLDPDQFVVPFELASVLLLAALVGAAYLARRRRAP